MSPRHPSRREFLGNAAALGAGLVLGACAAPRLGRILSPDERLRLAFVGVGGRGHDLLAAMSGEAVVALCDVDDRQSERARAEHPEARTYHDYRVLLEKEGDGLDGLVVATPDHMHAPIAMAAMRRGLHVYCEKPLTWSIGEARALAHAAAEHRVVTQMGNQGSAADGFRRGVERLRAGVIGDVTAIHCWTNRPVWPQAIPEPPAAPLPEGLHWDLWLGAAPSRPYGEGYLPFAWRGWYDFGTGALGDMACHTLNLAYRGCQLGPPDTVEATTTPLFDASYPAGARIVFRFPKREARPAVTLTWYDGQMRPPADLLPKALASEMPGSGLLVVGTRGMMFSPDDYGAEQVYEPAALADVDVPATLPRSPGHQAEWIAACKGGPKPWSSFDIAGPFTEMVLLGNLAVRTGRSIGWNAEAMRAEGVPEADRLVRRDYRPGFSI